MIEHSKHSRINNVVGRSGIDTELGVMKLVWKGHEHARCALCGPRHCSPLRVRFGWGVEAERPGDGGMLGAELEGASPLMISWIEASSASTRCDICTTMRARVRSAMKNNDMSNALRSTIWDDISSNLASSCSSNVSTCESG